MTNWNQHYLDKHTPWDKGAPAPPLLEWLEKNPESISGRALVPGCGLGRDCQLLAEKTSASEIIGIDISTEAVKQAQETSPAPAIHYNVEDLFQLSSRYREAFDWVWEHTCFCAIDPALRDDYVRAVHGALKKNGTLLAVFYLDPYDDEHAPCEGPPYGTSLWELHDRFVNSGLFRERESYVPAQSYPGRETLERLIRYEKV